MKFFEHEQNESFKQELASFRTMMATTQAIESLTLTEDSIFAAINNLVNNSNAVMHKMVAGGVFAPVGITLKTCTLLCSQLKADNKSRVPWMHSTGSALAGHL